MSGVPFWVRVVHLLAAAVWTGGLITLAVLVSALRRAGASRDMLRAAARAFGWLSWCAFALAVATGLTQLYWMGLPWSYPPLHLKLALVVLAFALALGHQLTARRSSPAVRGVIQLALLLLGVGLFFAAVRLRPG